MFLLEVFDTRQDFILGGAVAPQLVGNDPPRDISQSLGYRKGYGDALLRFS
jgi:hypothetical protein